MREFHYSQFYSQMLQPDIVALLTRIHEFKGEQAWFIETKAGVLTNLMEVAKIQSTEASNKIEGIYTSDERLKKLVQDKTTPRTRNEQEIAGYRDVLATICESFDYIPPKPAMSFTNSVVCPMVENIKLQMTNLKIKQFGSILYLCRRPRRP